MSSLADFEKKSLLEIARRALIAAVKHPKESDAFALGDLPRDPALFRPAGAFVTLTVHGRLRGCIGQLPSGLPLVQVVAHCARAVASEDSRFNPVREDELGLVEIELSVLSDPQDILPEAIEVGVHGLIVSNDRQRGVLLPQVAPQFRWTATRFVEATCEKAALPRDAWKWSATRLQAFTAKVFSEGEFRETKPA